MPRLICCALTLLLGPGCAARARPAAAPTARAIPPDCPHGAPDPAARMAEGLALISGSMVGEHPVGWGYLWGLQALKEAADAGYAPALYAWGKERFSGIYLDAAPTPDDTAQRQVLTVAMAMIATASRLGETKASAFFPGDVLAGLLDPAGPFPDRIGDELPMADIPNEWFEEARIIATHYRECW